MYIDFYKTRRYIINICLVLLTLGFLYYCYHDIKLSNIPVKNNNITPNFCYVETQNYIIKYNEMLDKPVEKKYNIEGSFINKSNNIYSSVTLIFSLIYDNEKIGTATAIIYNLEPYRQYYFAACNKSIMTLDTIDVTAVLVEININL